MAEDFAERVFVMSLVIGIGKWGGFYIYVGYCLRVCLGWLTITFIPQDFDELMNRALDDDPK